MQNQIERRGLMSMGLSRKESEVFLVLIEKGSQKATDIARHLGKPRTSVLLILDELTEKGFVERIKVGGHFEWEAASLDTIENMVKEKIEHFEKALPSLRDLVKAQTFGKKFGIKVFSGATGLLQAYYRLLDLKAGERIYYFEGVDSVRAKMRMRDQSVVKWQEAFKKSGVIIEALGSLKSFHEIKKRKGSDILSVHLDRLLITHALPDSITDFPCDIAVLPNTTLFFIPKEEIVILIDSSDLAHSFRKIFEGLKMVSTTLDANTEIKKLLA
jgi:predicted transcriptional regulator